MRQYAVEPSVITYNAAISACEGVGLWQHALGLLLGMRLDRVTYNAAISACEQGHRWRHALALLTHMLGPGRCFLMWRAGR